MLTYTDGARPVGNDDKEEVAHIEQIRTTETNGDRVEHDCETPMSFARIMSLVAMAFLWTGSQIPVYLFGAVPPYIYRDIGGVDRWVWFVLANLLSLAAVCPFVGSISDLIGRRYVAIVGASLLVISMIICSTVHDMNYFICGVSSDQSFPRKTLLTELFPISDGVRWSWCWHQ